MRHSIICVAGPLVDSYLKISDEELASFGIPKGQMVINETKNALEKQLEMLLEKHEFTAVAAGGSAFNTLKVIREVTGFDNLALLGQYGGDEGGKIISDNLKSLGIRNYSIVKKGDSTSRLYICVTPDAQRTVIGDFYNSFQLDTSKADFSVLKGFDYVLVEAYSFSENPSEDGIWKTLEHISKFNKKMIFALSNRSCTSTYKKEMLHFINHENCKIIIGNVGEFMNLLDEFKNIDDLIDSLIAKDKYEALVITDGGNGAYVVVGKEKLFVKAPSVPEVVDTTGAGDYFAGGFLSALFSGKDIKTCVKVANILAGDVIQKVGISSSKEALAEAQKVLKGESKKKALILPSHVKNCLEKIHRIKNEVDLVINVSDSRSLSSTNLKKTISNLFKDAEILDLFSKSDLSGVRKPNSFDFRQQSNRNKILSLIKVSLFKKRSFLLKQGYLNPHFQILVVGLPNVGKSTLINLLIGKEVTHSANIPGVTKKVFRCYLGDNLWIYDSPGILFPSKLNSKDIEILFLIDSIPSPLQDYSEILKKAFEYLKKNYKQSLEMMSGSRLSDYGTFIKQVAKRFNFVKKENILDIARAEEKFLSLIRQGAIKNLRWDL